MASSFVSVITHHRTYVVLVALMVLVVTLFYVEHPSVRAIKNIASIAGLIDSQYTILGVTDVRSIDHTLGDFNADLVLLEYSDFTCILCAAMQENLKRFVRENKVLLVSRHLYISNLGRGYERAVAAECAGKNGGKDTYRAYMEFLYENQSSIAGEKDLVRAAVGLGVDSANMTSCIASDAEIRRHITKDSENGFALGAKGTPYIVAVYKGVPIGVSYANDYKSFTERIDTLLNEHRRQLRQ